MSPGHRIVLAPQTALQSNSDTIWVALDSNLAHDARKYNKLYVAVWALRHQANVTIALTATPVLTRPSDLWHVGRFMGLSGFEGPNNNNKSRTMNKEINASQRKVCRSRKQDNLDATLLRGVMVGNNKFANDNASEYRTSILSWMNVMRDKFAGSVIRRTVDSKDFSQQPISGLSPHTEHPLLLSMYNWERKNLHNIAKELVDDHPTAAYYGAGKSSLHPKANEARNTEPSEKPFTLEEWCDKAMVTVKLDVLGQVIDYHLQQDGRQLVMATEDGRHIQPDNRYGSFERNPAECDKIVVYSAFPTSNHAILDILAIYGIEAVELNGSVPVKKRQAAIDAFRTSNKESGPCVLILSGVGMVGLNLVFANVLIIVDTLWSDQEDAQLRGRVWRQPQTKQVHIYRLIATGTPDVFLNNISFDKGVMHAAFVGTDVISLTDDDDAILSLGDDDNTDIPATSRGKGKAVAKPKIRPKCMDKGKGKAVSNAPDNSTTGSCKRKLKETQADHAVAQKKARKQAPSTSMASGSGAPMDLDPPEPSVTTLPSVQQLRIDDPLFDQDPEQEEEAALAALKNVDSASSPLTPLPSASDVDVEEHQTTVEASKSKETKGPNKRRRGKRTHIA
ncbi:hypothetical protein SERLA73DRAFT_67866 [Serpula lacrymans var. lacrymans S7.3]|uniref:Helicase C-terminal domain-containing protein n=2 Tax=Serpula lacrymans var. lacrymans TaxID=341189 RepID=F8PET6_SERL3|nr:uncharacterized protein SERLADRAFT_431568 [Serpula lacrymans var. lacrymans S7.9]EGO04147.1 hypothetical protein SERLA73DRAFT_67866 [Serpula lacrymans var. lacrymans S7.3]EGO30101.1 hypothetical protein SERLADRAFT_431568 [Serpula lacrymans var. lacrymans S7.9]